MKPVTEPKFEDRAAAPQFDLPATNGGRAMTWGYKGQRSLVIAFLSDASAAEGRRLLEELKTHYSEYHERNAEILVVSQDNIEKLDKIMAELDLPFPLASDVDGTVTAGYTNTTPALFVLDRYGEICSRSDTKTGGPFPDHQRILDWLHLIELQYPERGVSTWAA